MILLPVPKRLPSSPKIIIACCLFLLIAGLALHFVADITHTPIQSTATLHLHLPLLLEPFLPLTFLLALISIQLLSRLIPNHWLQPPTTPPPIRAA